MDIEVLFYTRKDFGGWRRYAWLPVAWVQGALVHCEIFFDGAILTADNRRGVLWREVGPYRPSATVRVAVDWDRFDVAAERAVGLPYSWSAFFELLIPRWLKDPGGMICSELVAYMLRESAVDYRYRWPFVAVPPYRWTPEQLYLALKALEYHGHV